MKTLNRRDFLKLTGLASTAGAGLLVYQALDPSAGLFADPQIYFGSLLLRGTSHGAILASSDEGQTWNQLVNFGQPHTILRLEERNGQIFANLGIGRHDFWLKSIDGIKWMTT